MSNKLILFSSDFPFGSGETFLEAEIGFLAANFDEVLIVSSNCKDKQTRVIPTNCSTESLDLSTSKFEKIRSLFNVFQPLFWQELFLIKKTYKRNLTKGILSTMLISISRARKVKKYCQQLFSNNKTHATLYYYSYWSDDVAIGLAMFREMNPGITAISRMHGWDVYFEASPLNYLPYRHFISKNLSAIFAISDKGKAYAASNWKIENIDKIRVARLGVPEQKQYPIQSNKFILVSCSNVIPLKRVELIVKALAKIEDKKIEWVHFGDGPLLNEVEKLANEMLPVNVSVTFKGRVANQEVINWYAENNPCVFINLSSTEGIPVSIMEAMSLGIPVIATDVGGTSEIVNNKNGLLLSANPSEGEISDAITSFVKDRERMSLKSTVAYKTCQKHYNADVNYSSFIDSLLHHS
jgi:glycosyltransferase involved in cell wall biosynthesis